MSKVAIKTSEGLFLSAEQGGGLHYGDTGFINMPYPGIAPIYGNREIATVWETFNLIKNDDNTISLMTWNGMYVSADYGGGVGISTDKKENKGWERFFHVTDTHGRSSFLCFNQIHFLTVEQGTDRHVNATRESIAAWQEFDVVNLEPNVTVDDLTEEEIRDWQGNLCGLPLGLDYSPNGILFTPSYVIYPDDVRDRIRKTYRDNGWRHFPINLTNHSPIYRDVFPDWDDSLINQYLTELLNEGLIPVGYSMGDNDTVINCKAEADLVPIALGKWEDAKPLVKPELDARNTFHLVRERFPKSIIYWHNPPYQGAPFVEYSDWGLPQDDPGINAKVWQYMVHECGVRGLMFQGKAWEKEGSDSISTLRSFIDRLGYGQNGWPAPVDIIDYEETAYYMFNMNGSYSKALDMTKKIRDTFGSELQGYGNG
jgi:hypothetical protein